MSPLRKYSRATCDAGAIATMTYGYNDATAVLGPLSPQADPSALDLCREHANTVTVPRGWTLIRLADNFEPPQPSTSDLMALADAIRATSTADVPTPQSAQRHVARPGNTVEVEHVRNMHPSNVKRPRLSLVQEEKVTEE